MTRPLFSALPIVLLALAGTPAAAQTVPDFQLPPPTPTPTATAQGPIDPDNPVAQRPRVIATPTPTPSRTPSQDASPTPTATPAPTPSATRAPAPTLPQPSPAARSPAQARATGEPAETAATTAPASTQPAAEATSDTAGPLDEFTAPAPLPTPDSASQVEEEPGEGGIEWWMAVLALLVAGGIGFALFRRRAGAAQAQPAEIERPRVDRAAAQPRPEPAADPVPEPARPRPAAKLATPAAPRQRVELAADALRVVRSFANITLAYRFEIANRGAVPVEGLRITGDLVSAHGGVPVDQQLAEPTAELPLLHELATLAPGEVRECQGEIRLPLQAVRPIWQGKAPLMVPLLRLILVGEGIAPYAHTLVVGRRPDPVVGAARLQPFRLDEQAQTYRDVATRALG